MKQFTSKSLQQQTVKRSTRTRLI